MNSSAPMLRGEIIPRVCQLLSLLNAKAMLQEELIMPFITLKEPQKNEKEWREIADVALRKSKSIFKT